MAKPTRHTAAAMQLGEIDLIAREVRRANRAPGRTEWYREVLVERRGARHVATGRPVAADGSVGERVEFSEGPQHQTYEVRDIADLDGPLTRGLVYDMRATARAIIARHTRLDITADQVERMFYGELIETLAMLRGDAEAEAYDANPAPADADPEVAEALAATAPATTAAPIAWRSKAGHYIATGPAGPLDAEVRRDPQATPANRWVARIAGERISAHRLLMSAKRAVERKLNARTATDQARAAVAQHAADLGVSTADAERDLRRRAADLDPQYAALLRAGLPESYTVGDRELTVPQAIGVVVDLLVEGCPITRLGDTWAARRGDDFLMISAAVIDAAVHAGVVSVHTGDPGSDLDRDRAELVPLRPGTVVTIAPLARRQFEVIEAGLDGLVRVTARRIRCEHDIPKWVGLTYVRPVPADQVEQVPEDDDPEYDAYCPGHEPRPAAAAPIDKAAVTATRIGSLLDSGAPAELLARCWHGTWVTLRAMPRGWWHLGSNTLCDDKGPHVPEDVDAAAVYGAVAAARPAPAADAVPDLHAVTVDRPGGGTLTFALGMLVTIGPPDGPAWRIDRLLTRGGVTPEPYAVLCDPADVTITCGSFVGDLRFLPAERVVAVEAGHDVSIVLARKLDAGNLVQAVCSCGDYTSAPATPATARAAGEAHRTAKTTNAVVIRSVAAELLDLAGDPLNRAQVMVPPGLLRDLAAALNGVAILSAPVRDPLGAPAGAGERARKAAEALPTVGRWVGAPPELRNPYVGEGVDGARRSADIDRAEADTFDTGSSRWQRCMSSAERWDRQAAYLESQAYYAERDRVPTVPNFPDKA